MKPDDINLSSVNWEHGMLLAPDHFLRQEEYFDSALLWILRYATNAYGLVGGGARVAESERGALRYDPIVTIGQDAEFLRLAVTQCRALTPCGCIVEVDPQHPLQCEIPKRDLEGVAESPVYIVCEPHKKDVLDGEVDPFNPQMPTERRPAYRLTLNVPANENPYSVAVARLSRRRTGVGYESDAKFIPPCTTMSSYSELTGAWRDILASVNQLSGRYAELHRAMRDFIALFTERGIETDVEPETMRFVDRMLAALQDCLYELLDPVQTPQRFFGHLRRFFHTAAVYLELTPAVQLHFDTLRQAGETEFISPLEHQRQILSAMPKWDLPFDLGIEVRSALQSLSALHRLERALEGKYIDFRNSPTLDAMNFVFDRGGKELYKLAAKPSRVQGVADELTIYFSQLHLEGRDEYRLIVVGEVGTAFEKGTRIDVTIRVNEGSGFRGEPIFQSCTAESSEQVNFAFDFKAPGLATITDLRVSLQAHLPIRTALLFSRHRFYADRGGQGARNVESRTPNEMPPPRPALTPDGPRPRVQPATPVADVPATDGPSREPQPPAPRRPEPNRAPWETPPPPRRRRLE